MQCPKCFYALFEFCYPNTLTLVDACINCSGIWLDDLEWKQISTERNPASQMTCPKCSKQQKKSGSCIQCGIIIDKYLAIEKAAKEPGIEAGTVAEADTDYLFSTDNYRKALNSSNVFKQL